MPENDGHGRRVNHDRQAQAESRNQPPTWRFLIPICWVLGHKWAYFDPEKDDDYTEHSALCARCGDRRVKDVDWTGHWPGDSDD